MDYIWTILTAMCNIDGTRLFKKANSHTCEFGTWKERQSRVVNKIGPPLVCRLDAQTGYQTARRHYVQKWDSGLPRAHLQLLRPVQRLQLQPAAVPERLLGQGRSELHKQGHMTAGHRLFCKELPCFNTMPRRGMPFLRVHFRGACDLQGQCHCEKGRRGERRPDALPTWQPRGCGESSISLLMGWNSQVHRGFPGKSIEGYLSMDNLSRDKF